MKTTVDMEYFTVASNILLSQHPAWAEHCNNTLIKLPPTNLDTGEREKN